MKGLREVIKNINDYNSVFGLTILEDCKELKLKDLIENNTIDQYKVDDISTNELLMCFDIRVVKVEEC